MPTKPAVFVSADDETRTTLKVVHSLPENVRVAVARLFVGFHVRMEVEPVRGAGTREVEVAVEGCAQIQSGNYSWALVTTEGGKLHDLSDMQVYPLSTIRSINTLRRF